MRPRPHGGQSWKEKPSNLMGRQTLKNKTALRERQRIVEMKDEVRSAIARPNVEAFPPAEMLWRRLQAPTDALPRLGGIVSAVYPAAG